MYLCVPGVREVANAFFTVAKSSKRSVLYSGSYSSNLPSMHRYICGEIVRCFASGRLLMAPRICVRDEHKEIKSTEEIVGKKIPYTVILGFFLAACGKMYSISMDPVTEVITKIRTVALGQHTTLNDLHFSKADVTTYREKLLYFIKNGKQLEGRETSRTSWVLDKDGT